MPDRPSRTYELLVAELTTRLAAAAGIDTEQVRHDVLVKGKATDNQIDVLWDFRDATGAARRIVFEVKHHQRPIDQGRLHTLRSVVNDIQDPDRPVTGVMVTLTGYQKGAKSIAETYGLLVLELREPEEHDWSGRVHTVHLEVRAQRPEMTGLRVEAVAQADEAPTSSRVDPADLYLLVHGQTPRLLRDALFEGELGTLRHPRPPHPVRREYDPPARLFVGPEWLADAAVIHAIVGDLVAPPLTVTVGGTEAVAYVIRDALSGARLWLAHDGRTWSTEE